MNVESETFLYTSITEASPSAFILGVDVSSKKKRTPIDRNKARSWNEKKKPINPDVALGHPQHRETALNIGIIKRSQRRSMRPH